MTVIELAGAGKRYVKYKDTPSLVMRARSLRNRTLKSDIWAVRNIDLQVGKGECVGVIGRNGAGKSTLLQLVAGTTRPTEGRVRVAGHVAPLISVGVGFHPELTGRENVFINGMILGRSRADLERRFDAIVAFSEIENFIDTPVKFYSSGMLVRLGFSVAVNVDPDVLLVDEVLAVGDLAFQLKCVERMKEVRVSGATILVVSHGLSAVRRLCDRTILLHDGRELYTGDTEEAIARYHEVMDAPRSGDRDVGLPGNFVDGAAGRAAVVESAEIVGADGRVTAELEADEPITLRLRIRFDEPVDSPVFGMAVHSDSGTPVYSDSSGAGNKHAYRAGDRVTCCIVLENTLAAGGYRVIAGVYRNDMRTGITGIRPIPFSVAGGAAIGIADLHARYKVTREKDEVTAPDVVITDERP